MSESLLPLTDSEGGSPVYGYRCADECLAYQGYGHHEKCKRVEMIPRAANSSDARMACRASGPVEGRECDSSLNRGANSSASMWGRFRIERITATGRKPINDITYRTLAEAKQHCARGDYVVRMADGAAWYCGPSGKFKRKAAAE